MGAGKGIPGKALRDQRTLHSIGKHLQSTCPWLFPDIGPSSVIQHPDLSREWEFLLRILLAPVVPSGGNFPGFSRILLSHQPWSLFPAWQKNRGNFLEWKFYREYGEEILEGAEEEGFSRRDIGIRFFREPQVTGIGKGLWLFQGGSVTSWKNLEWDIKD